MHAAEQNVDSAILDAYRAQGEEDLAQFLELRAEELIDDGFGLYLMVGQSGQDAQHTDLNFIRKPKSLYVEAFENAAKDFERAGKAELANLTKQAQVMTKFPMFTRRCEDIKKTLSKEGLRNVLELVEIGTKECLVDNKTGEGMADFLWSVQANSLIAALKTWSEGLQEDNSNLDLTSTITEAVKKQMTLLAQRDFPDGRHYITYTYIVVKRQPRV